MAWISQIQDQPALVASNDMNGVTVSLFFASLKGPGITSVPGVVITFLVVCGTRMEQSI